MNAQMKGGTIIRRLQMQRMNKNDRITNQKTLTARFSN